MLFLKIHIESTQQYFSAPYDTAQKETFPTETAPTMNAIVGMIGRAMGLQRGHEAMDSMKETLLFKYINTRNNRPVVKAEFRVTSLNENERFMKMDGTSDDRGQLKNIEFVQDAAYNVYIGGDQDTLSKIHHAFAHPYWPVYIGRAQCVPTHVIVEPNPEFIAEEDLPNVHDCP